MGGAFSAFPVAGSVSRSAVSSDSGAKSRTAGLVAAALVGLTLTCLTPVFAHLPLFALAAIVISGVLGLVDYPEAIRHLYQTNRLDFAVWLTACFGTLLAGVETGLGCDCDCCSACRRFVVQGVTHAHTHGHGHGRK